MTIDEEKQEFREGFQEKKKETPTPVEVPEPIHQEAIVGPEAIMPAPPPEPLRTHGELKKTTHADIQKQMKFGKMQILRSKKYQNNRDMLSVLLKDKEEYTHEQVQKMLGEFRSRAVDVLRKKARQ